MRPDSIENRLKHSSAGAWSPLVEVNAALPMSASTAG